MKRRDFLKACSFLGLSIPFQSCGSSHQGQASRLNQSVLIIGAGAAGLSAGYLLNQLGTPYTILEASAHAGGRMKHSIEFADFPIALGAEWLHASRQELVDITNRRETERFPVLQGYSDRDRVGHFEDGELGYYDLGQSFGSNYEDKKFINSSWMEFFNQHIIPSIKANIQFNKHVIEIDTNGEKIIATDTLGQTYLADKLIITVPLRILHDKAITFNPALPVDKQRAIARAPLWGGFKAFLSFDRAFYPTFLTFANSETPDGQKLYYDAAYGQQTSQHILGLFAVGKQARPYQQLSESDRLAYILDELDAIFNNQASSSFRQHIFQDWDKEPYIHSAYLADPAPPSLSRILFAPVNNRIFFAGEAYTAEADWGAVHNATRSAREVVSRIAGSL